MNNTFYKLDNNDILLFKGNTFIVDKFKELLLNVLKEKMFIDTYKFEFIPGHRQMVETREKFTICLLEPINSQYDIENKAILKVNQSCMNTISEEIDCQLLKLGDTSWKSGKLRFKAIANYNNSSEPPLAIEIELEFCPDKPEPLETSDSSLDELRQKLQIYQ
ncbi:KGK domain-containing protein [Planktothrix sp. FACHB-1365]|uniref:KGK domain-containing protein n=1 Tax=Planktothrix sp. FACHB-1365 TaxID=2692855 RepID=UPI0019A3B458|nr:KGK domain-containing protein [Planktothrix sp. FACHB-1365]MBD2481622.1 hypothetical protein [Planktothrix sp. FACHB-1365]